MSNKIPKMLILALDVIVQNHFLPWGQMVGIFLEVLLLQVYTPSRLHALSMIPSIAMQK